MSTSNFKDRILEHRLFKNISIGMELTETSFEPRLFAVTDVKDEEVTKIRDFRGLGFGVEKEYSIASKIAQLKNMTGVIKTDFFFDSTGRRTSVQKRYDSTLAQAKSLSFIDKLDVVAKLAESLANLHRAKILHSNLREENIFIQGYESDFGRAKEVDLAGFDLSVDMFEEAHVTGETWPFLGGTDPYQALEIFEKKAIWTPDMSIDQKVQIGLKPDIFSFGVILMNLLGPPNVAHHYTYSMHDCNDSGCFQRHVNEALKGLRDASFRSHSDFRKHLNHLMMQCLSLNGKRRPTAGHLKDSLERVFSLIHFKKR